MWVEVTATDHNKKSIYSEYHFHEEDLSVDEITDRLSSYGIDLKVKVIDRPPNWYILQEVDRLNEDIRSSMTYLSVLNSLLEEPEG